jgi:hypothetical protein
VENEEVAMSNAARIALIGGQGWPLTETAAGLPTMQRRLSAQGVEVQTFAHDARQEIHDWLHGHSGFRALIGDSLGAGRSCLASERGALGLTSMPGVAELAAI